MVSQNGAVMQTSDWTGQGGGVKWPARQLFRQGERLWPELVCALAPLAVYWRIVFGGQVLYWGLPALQFVPWRVLVNDALRHGQWPLWTSLLGMGAPLLANHQSAVFYPPNWLALLLPPETAVSVLAVLHLSLAGVGAARLARMLGVGPLGAAVSGLTFGLSGYLTARLWFISIDNTMAWLPWVLLFAPRPAPSPVANPRARFLALSLVIALQLLAGHAQSSFYTLLIAAAWVCGWAAVRGQGTVISDQRAVSRGQRSEADGQRSSLMPAVCKGNSSLLSRLTSHVSPLSSLLSPLSSLFSPLSSLLLSSALALALTAAQLLPTLELLRESPRANTADYTFATTYSLWPWRLLTFAAPNFFGHPADHNYWGYGSYWEDDAYLGLVPLLFAAYALWHSIRNRKQTAARFVLAVLAPLALLSITLALGKNTPLFPFLYRYVPGFNLFQAPARMTIGYTLALSLLAGLGAHHWQPSARARYWARLGIAGSLAALIFGEVAAQLFADPHVATFASGLTGAALVAVGAWLLILNRPATPNRWQWAVAAFIALDLGWAAARLSPTADSALYHLPPSFTLAEGRVYQSAADEYRVKFGDFFRFQSFDPLDAQALRDSLLPNLSVLSGAASVNNFDPLLPARYVTYLKAMEASPRLMDLADVRAIVKPMGTVETRYIASRARLVYNAQTAANGDSALASLTAPAFDPDSTVILEPDPAPALARGFAVQHETFTVTLARDGYFLLSDTFYPGWRVRVDGHPRPLFRADYTFRAVAVPAGTHTVEFEYAPLSFAVGLTISALAALVWVGLLLIRR
ncbi:MAG: YfhO family protein [Chloroflexi bacterium]|nr:YfhO family protein [Chloroflexota bacterium]